MVTDLGIIDVGLKPVPEVRRWLAISECMWGERERERERALENMMQWFISLT